MVGFSFLWLALYHCCVDWPALAGLPASHFATIFETPTVDHKYPVEGVRDSRGP